MNFVNSNSVNKNVKQCSEIASFYMMLSLQINHKWKLKLDGIMA